MAQDGKSEVRFEFPNDDLAVLDAYYNSTGKSRTAVICDLLNNWTKNKRHEATVICRVAGINPMRPESDSGRTPAQP